MASSIFEEKMQQGFSNDDFAILYRTNAQSRAMEEALRRVNIKYKVVGGLSFYQRKEVKDMLGYLRLTINPNDVEAFRRIVNLPKRGIGDTSVEKVILAAYENQKSLWDVLSDLDTYFKGTRMSESLKDFVTMIQSFQLLIKTKDAFEAASHIAKVSGLLLELYNDKTVEGRVRYDNLQELLNAVKGFVDDPEAEDKSLETFLQQVSLLTSNDETDDSEPAVTMMTIHMSKGLEFKHVFIVGMEENLFPSQMMLESRTDLEEERRLFYVAITRAEKKLTLAYALQRYRFGKLVMSEPSRFIDEIDPKYLRMSHLAGYESPDMATDNRPKSNSWSYSSKNSSPKKESAPSGNISPTAPTPVPSAPKPSAIHHPSANFKPSPSSEIKAGQRVEHQKFGFGIIQEIEAYNNDKRAKILFETNGEKTLILSFAKLMIVG